MIDVMTMAPSSWVIHLADHSRRVARYAVALAAHHNVPGETLRLTRDAAFLHDVGKLAISPDVIQAARPLSADETRLVRLHPETGEEILRGGTFSRLWAYIRFAPAFEDWASFVGGDTLSGRAEIAAIVRHHHERYDGAGYPDGLRSTDIPFPARVVAIADTFDTLTSHRPYRAALGFDAAMGEVERAQHDGQLSPNIDVHSAQIAPIWRMIWAASRE